MRSTRIHEPFSVRGGAWMAKALPLHKWRRKQGMATFVRDLIDLRKTLVLCGGCERKMPYRWMEKYDYALVRGYNAAEAACDWCRQNNDHCNLYHTTHGKHHERCELAKQSIEETEARERDLYMKDRRYFIGV